MFPTLKSGLLQNLYSNNPVLRVAFAVVLRVPSQFAQFRFLFFTFRFSSPHNGSVLLLQRNRQNRADLFYRTRGSMEGVSGCSFCRELTCDRPRMNCQMVRSEAQQYETNRHFVSTCYLRSRSDLEFRGGYPVALKALTPFVTETTLL